LARLNPVLLVKRGLAVIPQFIKRLERQMSLSLDRRKRLIGSTVARLNALSPLAILGRGYSLLFTALDGEIIRRSQDVRAGDKVVARLSEGQLHCTVDRVLPDASV